MTRSSKKVEGMPPSYSKKRRFNIVSVSSGTTLEDLSRFAQSGPLPVFSTLLNPSVEVGVTFQYEVVEEDLWTWVELFKDPGDVSRAFGFIDKRGPVLKAVVLTSLTRDEIRSLSSRA